MSRKVLMVVCLVMLAAIAVSGWYWQRPLSAALGSVAAKARSAAVFFVVSITSADLRIAYRGSFPPDAPQTPAAAPVVRILLVPGHEPDFGGTAFGDYTERDIAVEIAQKLAAMLETNPRYEVMIARTKDAWHPTLENYFSEHQSDIDAFRISQQTLMQQYLASGQILPEGIEQVEHNTAPPITALHLYGINKWASENDIGITLHIHINDYPGRSSSGQGKYTGFVVYVPEKQYSNAAASREIGEALAKTLNRYHATSSMPQESAGVVDDQELIAIGSNNSIDAASMLIEYGYIYEKQFRNPATRDVAENDYAYETYLGLQDFFEDPLLSRFGTNALPHQWSSDLLSGAAGPDVYAMQAALHHIGMYPPRNETFNDCPISGFFGPCTKAGVSAFQASEGLPETGELDEATRRALFAEYLRR